MRSSAHCQLLTCWRGCAIRKGNLKTVGFYCHANLSFFALVGFIAHIRTIAMVSRAHGSRQKLAKSPILFEEFALKHPHQIAKGQHEFAGQSG
jgi:hypothetical protein